MMSSKRRKMPEMTSFTSVCAPKPMARPAIPAPARSGPISSPISARIMIAAKVQTMYFDADTIRFDTVSARCFRGSMAERSTTDSFHRSVSRRTMPMMSSARKKMTTTWRTMVPSPIQRLRSVARSTTTSACWRRVAVVSACIRYGAVRGREAVVRPVIGRSARRCRAALRLRGTPASPRRPSRRARRRRRSRPA